MKKIALLADGVLALEKMGRDHFPQAIQIVDHLHAHEHLENLIEALIGKADARRFTRRRYFWRKLLLAEAA